VVGHSQSKRSCVKQTNDVYKYIHIFIRALGVLMRIMVVDDDAVTRNLFQNFMKSSGYEIHEAVNGSDALKKVDPHLDVIFLDWLMPIMSGLEFLEQFRVDKRMANVKVVMLTALSDIDNVVDAMDRGADDYIIKPFTKDVLMEKIGKLTV